MWKTVDQIDAELAALDAFIMGGGWYLAWLHI